MAQISTSIDNGRLFITVEGFDPFIIDPSELPEDLVFQAALHGFKQKYVDKAALGAEATLTEKHAAIRSMVRYHAGTGEWSMTSAGEGTSGDGLLVRALMRVAGLDRDGARTAVAGMDKKVQAAMRTDPTIAPVIARLRGEKPARKPSSDVDTGALLRALKAA
jgi:hypothetical protein